MASSKKTAILGLFTALIIALQVLSYFVKVGTFSISLTLIPIVLAAVMYGPSYGAVLGAVFGAVTFIGCITGIDAGGQMLLQSSPVITLILTLFKGAAAGFAAGIIARPLYKNHKTFAVILSAITAPIVNTGIFIAFLVLFFKDTLYIWAGGNNIAYYVVFSLVGINFLIELSLNAILSPAILRVTKILKK